MRRMHFAEASGISSGRGRPVLSWGVCSTMGTLLYGDRSGTDDCAPGTQFSLRGIFIVVSILVMMPLCRIIRSFLGYIVCGDIGVFPS